MGEGQRDGVGAVRCRAVVLASGGLGQVFSQTTNPAVSTGDGMALALRAGAVLRDLEFVQFHPTVMYLGPDSRGQQPLISEAVRGEGAFLVDFEGNRFMQGVHELADLAPRDVVAKAITRRMHETGQPHMWLDARHLGAEFWEQRFPTILATCRSHGVDPVTELIPVAPACHYASGGVAHRPVGPRRRPRPLRHRRGRLLGVHGANRLASNSLLEGLVFSRRIAHGAARGAAPAAPSRPTTAATAGLVRRRRAPRAPGGDDRAGRRAAHRRRPRPTPPGCSTSWPASPPTVVDQESWETTNLLTISTALAEAARSARRPAARTGARTSPSATTPTGPATSTSRWMPTARPHCSSRRPRPRSERPHDRSHARTTSCRAPARRAGRRRSRPRGGLRRRSCGRSTRTCPAATTSPARPPSAEDARGAAVFAAREAGVVAGLGVAALVFAYVLGDDVEVTDRVPTAPASRPATS